MTRIYVIERKSKRGKVWRMFDTCLTNARDARRWSETYRRCWYTDYDYRIAIYERKEVLP